MHIIFFTFPRKIKHTLSLPTFLKKRLSRENPSFSEKITIMRRNHRNKNTNPNGNQNRNQMKLSIGVITLAVCVCLVTFKRLSSQQVGKVQKVENFREVFHSPEAFKLEYDQMESNFKVFVYPDGDPNTYYQTPRTLTGKYASEGYFFQNIRETKLRTDDPEKAHMFFIPVSCHKMRGEGHSYENMTVIVQNYVESLISKYPYWNRTQGADHFFVTCHDIGVRATEGVSHLVKNSIRVVCSASYDGGYIPHKDIALPQVRQPFKLPAAREEDMKNRPTLGFWAGQRNSELRVVLVSIWGNDSELDIQTNRIIRATGHLVYKEKFKSSKFCICPAGSRLNTARIADSIRYGCVPVILSGFYDLPFNDILDWRKFSVILKEDDVYHLKSFLKDITDAELKTLQRNLLAVQKHFEWNKLPERLDAFHMVMYDLWLRSHVIKY